MAGYMAEREQPTEEPQRDWIVTVMAPNGLTVHHTVSAEDVEHFAGFPADAVIGWGLRAEIAKLYARRNEKNPYERNPHDTVPSPAPRDITYEQLQ